ncbi:MULTISPECIES: Txe/YoeB family addiction module toxin [unclassified Imperialibacter]|uniref:Txe/YoeB family addiction module toxin n=1 Tax=unclassified Imperialibacter TaxID=2629706 RepID=UPI00125F590E|nr:MULTISPECIES: Txe/YoeB family addiction module toxin [unclassified Imperialibacter]
MEVIYLPEAIHDLAFWKKYGNKKIQQRISVLVKAIQVDPFQGIGKPEPLRHNLSGKWSRRINAEHRLIYGVENNLVYVYSLRGHYK